MAEAEDVGVSSPPLRFLIVSEQLCQADGEIICLFEALKKQKTGGREEKRKEKFAWLLIC